MIFPIVMTPIFLSTLGEYQYGFYSLLVTTSGLLFMVSTFGLGFTARRELPSSNTIFKDAQLFYPQFYSHVLITSCLAAVAFLLIQGYFKHQYNANWSILTPIILSYLISYSVYSQFNLLFKYKRRIGLLNGLILFQVSINALLLFLSYGYYGALTVPIIFLCHLTGLLLACFVFFIPATNLVGIHSFFYKKKALREDLKFGLPLLLLTGLETFVAVSDRYIIAYFVDLKAVAAYVVPAMLCSLLLVIPRFVSIVVEPMTSLLVDQGNICKLKKMTQMLLYAFLALGLPAVCLSYILGTSIISIYVSADVGAEGGRLLWILMLGSTAFGLVMLMNASLLSHRKTKRLFYVNLIAAGINGALNLVIFNFYADIMVAAVTTLVSYVILLILTLKSVQTVLEIKVFDSEAILILLCALAALLFTQKLQSFADIEATILSIFSIGFIYASIYLVLLFLCRSKVMSSYHWASLNPS